MSDSVLSRIGVAIPAHNEEELLPYCLDAIAVAAAQVQLPVSIVVALDRCQDGTAAVVRAAASVGLDIRPVRSGQPGVGAGRSAALRSILAGQQPDQLWLATTDADSVVPPHWLRRQLDHAAAGADVVVGTVQISDWSDHSSLVRERYLAGYQSRPGHRHMHGANLSFRASQYLAAGGFDALDSDEDVSLIGRFEQLDAAMVWAADLAVGTSARRVGRAPSGFADFLVGLDRELGRGLDVGLEGVT